MSLVASMDNAKMAFVDVSPDLLAPLARTLSVQTNVPNMEIVWKGVCVPVIGASLAQIAPC